MKKQPAAQGIRKYKLSKPAEVKTPLTSKSQTLGELKHDGWRVSLQFTKSGIRIVSSRWKDLTDHLPHITSQEFPSYLIGTVIDCEAVSGKLGDTASILGSLPGRAVNLQKTSGLIKLYAFDMPFYCNETIQDKPFSKRRSYLEATINRDLNQLSHIELTQLILLDSVSAKSAFLVNAFKNGYEGIVLKSPLATYGAKYSMLKVKERYTIDALVTGWKKGRGKYSKTLGALLCSVIDEESGNLREITNVSPGTDSNREKMFNQLSALNCDWHKLEIVVEIEFQSWTKNARMRHARVIRYRTDKGEPNVINFDEIERK